MICCKQLPPSVTTLIHRPLCVLQKSPSCRWNGEHRSVLFCEKSHPCFIYAAAGAGSFIHQDCESFKDFDMIFVDESWWSTQGQECSSHIAECLFAPFTLRRMPFPLSLRVCDFRLFSMYSSHTISTRTAILSCFSTNGRNMFTMAAPSNMMTSVSGTLSLDSECLER